jgi:hypothetical protein
VQPVIPVTRAPEVSKVKLGVKAESVPKAKLERKVPKVFAATKE